MDNQTDQLIKLLALKNLEKPSQNYFDSVVPNFHRRLRARQQRSFLRRLVDSVVLPLESWRLPHAASAAALVVLSFSAVLFLKPVPTPSQQFFTSAPTVEFVNDNMEKLNHPDAASEIRQLILSSSALAENSISSQYVLDEKPAVYESGLSF